MNLLYLVLFWIVLIIVGGFLVFIVLYLEKIFKKKGKSTNNQDTQFHIEIIDKVLLHQNEPAATNNSKFASEKVELIDSNCNMSSLKNENKESETEVYISEFKKKPYIKFPTPQINSWKQKDNFNYYAIYDYYPRSVFETVPSEVEDIRKSIENFKNGYFNYSMKASEILSEVINSDVIKNVCNLNEYVLAIIPATSENKTRERFYHFCQFVTHLTRIRNGYECITVGKESQNLSGEKNKNKTDDFNYDLNLIADKKIILIDVIITTGETFIQNA